LTYKEKQIMETLSFILGIAFVVVIALAIVAVYAFVKVSKVNKELSNTQQTMSTDYERIYRRINDETSSLYRRIDETERNIFSQMDSRFDKLENKLTNKK
jgi:predicted PurR-regulated permease PerM